MLVTNEYNFVRNGKDKVPRNTELKWNLIITYTIQKNKTYTNETSIDINNFDAGLYIINIKGDNVNHYQKIIKQ